MSESYESKKIAFKKFMENPRDFFKTMSDGITYSLIKTIDGEPYETMTLEKYDYIRHNSKKALRVQKKNFQTRSVAFFNAIHHDRVFVCIYEHSKPIAFLSPGEGVFEYRAAQLGCSIEEYRDCFMNGRNQDFQGGNPAKLASQKKRAIRQMKKTEEKYEMESKRREKAEHERAEESGQVARLTDQILTKSRIEQGEANAPRVLRPDINTDE